MRLVCVFGLLLSIFPTHLLAGPHDHWWGNNECYPSDKTGVTFPIGVVLSLKAQEKYTRATVDDLFQKVNEVFKSQLNVYLNITQFVAHDTPQDYDNAGCDDEPIKTLSAFSQWTKGKTNVALWHLLDDCFENPCPDVCTAGLTYTMNRPCIDERNVALTYFTHKTWKTITHEIGHNFGADHSFTNNIPGITGGLMDYFNDTYLGLPQFNTDHAMDELCNGVEDAIKLCDSLNLVVGTMPHAQEPHLHPHELIITQYRSSAFATWFFLVLALTLSTAVLVFTCTGCRKQREHTYGRL